MRAELTGEKRTFIQAHVRFKSRIEKFVRRCLANPAAEVFLLVKLPKQLRKNSAAVACEADGARDNCRHLRMHTLARASHRVAPRSTHQAHRDGLRESARLVTSATVDEEGTRVEG